MIMDVYKNINFIFKTQVLKPYADEKIKESSIAIKKQFSSKDMPPIVSIHLLRISTKIK